MAVPVLLLQLVLPVAQLLVAHVLLLPLVAQLLHVRLAAHRLALPVAWE